VETGKAEGVYSPHLIDDDYSTTPNPGIWSGGVVVATKKYAR
jgi:hypothetical protein